jgi:nicotinamidase/pyrazinamidase
MKVLIMIDIQKDFIPGGSLAVEEGDLIIPAVNGLQPAFEMLVATQDWHPPGHVSFASSHSGMLPGDKIDLDGVEQMLWPDHCVQASEGAEFADDLNMGKVQKIIRKGTDPEIDSYSGFFDNQHKRDTGLHDYLQKKNVDTIFITGLAADVCVLYTTLDALDLDYDVFLVEDATKAVGGEKALRNTLQELKNKGAQVITSRVVTDLLSRQP